MESQTQTINISIGKKQDGVPIYKTNINPITLSTKKTTKIEKHDVDGVNGAYVLSNVLTVDECKQFIEITEKMGYADAPISTFGGMVMMKDVRDNKRVMWEVQEDLLKPIWERIKHLIPPEVELKQKKWKPVGLNERLRFYRYEPGEVFNRHYDGCYPRSNSEMTLLTFIIYLSDGFDGGHTTFYPTRRTEIQVKPVQGNALVFWHGPHPLSPEHEGSACAEGRKYVLRSDVMYKAE